MRIVVRNTGDHVQWSQTIDGGDGDDDKQIGHLTDRDGLRPVADHSEDREKSEGQTYPDIHPAHRIEQ